MRLSIVQKGDAVDKFVEGEFRAAHSEKIVVAVAGAGHEVVDEVVGTFEDRLGEFFEVLASEGIGAAGLFRIDSQIAGVNFDALLNGLFRLEIKVQGKRLAGAQDEFVVERKVIGRLHLQGVGAGFEGREAEFSIGVRSGFLELCAVLVLEGDGGISYGKARSAMDGAFDSGLSNENAGPEEDQAEQTQAQRTHRFSKPLEIPTS